VGPVGLEPVRQPVALVHRSHPFVAFRHSSDERNPADVTKEITPLERKWWALLVAFLAVERRVTEPMLALGLFRRRAFTGVQLAAFAVSGSMFVLTLGALLSFAGAGLALWLVREHDIERQPMESEREPESAALLEPAAA
jgi:hypothetical protein